MDLSFMVSHPCNKQWNGVQKRLSSDGVIIRCHQSLIDLKSTSGSEGERVLLRGSATISSVVVASIASERVGPKPIMAHLSSSDPPLRDPPLRTPLGHAQPLKGPPQNA
nr:hypothetical protein [Tanacetum cinerariifolium]GEX95225.1 hypothetical protein [Tanacetum cinerariifolium]